jgi:hypothetical protein
MRSAMVIAQCNHIRHSYLMSTTNTTTTNEVAKTILDQLGRRALLMLGAHTVVTSSDGVMFAVRGSRAVSKVIVKLDASDTYTVRFYKGRGINLVQVSEFEGVYADSLHGLIESATGLRTSL